MADGLDKKRNSKMGKNTGEKFELQVYSVVKKMIEDGSFLVSMPNVRVYHKKPYFSKERNNHIVVDVSVEKYLKNPDENLSIVPSLIIVLECKDYKGSIPVDDVEEFHAKLQQIGADNTKGVIISNNAMFQSGAISYAKSNGITLAAMFNEEQFRYNSYGDELKIDGEMTRDISSLMYTLFEPINKGIYTTGGNFKTFEEFFSAIDSM